MSSIQERIKKLEPVVDSGDKVELVLVNNAFVAVTNKNKSESTPAGVREWRKAKEELTELVASLERKYDKNHPQAEYFKNRKEAHTWLQEEGFKISIGKFYEDCKQKGFPVVNQDGTVSKYQVAVYGRALTSDQAPDPSALERSEYAHRKEKADAKIAEMKAERMEREEDALWLHADDAWSSLAAVIGDLHDAIRRAVHTAQVDLVVAAGGDINRAPELYEHLEQVVGGAFNEVAKKGIDVSWGVEE